MEMILIFDSNEEGDQDKFKRALFADEMAAAIWDITQMLRTMRKHGDYDDKEYAIIEKIEDDVHEHLERVSADILF